MSVRTSSDDQVLSYRRRCVEDERDLAGRGGVWSFVARIPLAVRAGAFVALHARQFYWTMTRALGLQGERRWAHMAGRSFLKPIAAMRPQARPRILVDVTMAARFEIATGIQRVVREFAKRGVETGSACPVVFEKGLVYEAYVANGAVTPLEIEGGDVLFLLDSSWSRLDDILPVIADIKGKRGKLAAFFFDTIPILYPDTCRSGVVGPFRRWFDTVIPLADAILTNARATADELRELTATLSQGSDLPIGVFPLGCEVRVATRRPPSEAVREVFEAPNVFLSVGTIEPRKGHPIALAAFERLWSQGSNARYVMIGRTGWNMRHFERRVRRHPDFGRRLFWLTNVDDADLAHAYAQARAVIVPSIAEGYGLPIIEAAAFGTDVILSDIDVFREVGHYARTTFFAVADPEDLAAKIEAVVSSARVPAGRKPDVPTWADVVTVATRLIRGPTLYARRGAIIGAEDPVVGGDGLEPPTLSV